ncbi:MAG: tRNA 2-thiouridine(34) synthase MnmA [Marinifilaceae bacterium]
MKEKILLGFSGGTDSFTSALLLKQAGYEIIAVTLHIWDFQDESFLEEASSLAKEIGIEHHIVEAKNLFKQMVVKPFISDYLNAKTPSPCSVCNNHIKFELLKQKADELGIDKIATGHYINIEKLEEKYYIRRGVDVNKDQSYFLWELSQEVLSRAVTPLGEYTKSEVRDIASKAGYGRVAHKKESMGVCFLENQSYISFLEKNQPSCISDLEEGLVYDENNQEIGRHKGLPFYTIGQKKDLFLKEGMSALYVKSMNKLDNSIVAANKPSLKTREIKVENYTFVDIKDISSDNIITNIRGWGLNPHKYSRIEILDDTFLKVHLEDDAWAVAPGQPVVFYIAEKLIGGGIAY